jgi:hypothetical protein
VSHGFRCESACHNKQLHAILQNSSNEEYLEDTEEEDYEEINVQIGEDINNGTEAIALQGKEAAEKETAATASCTIEICTTVEI